MTDRKFKSALDWYQRYVGEPRHAANEFKLETFHAVALRMDEELGNDATDDQRQAWTKAFLERYPNHRARRQIPADIAKYTPAEKLEFDRTGKPRVSKKPRYVKPDPVHPRMLKRQDVKIDDGSND